MSCLKLCITIKMKYQLKSQTIRHESAKLRFPGSNPGDASLFLLDVLMVHQDPKLSGRVWFPLPAWFFCLCNSSAGREGVVFAGFHALGFEKYFVRSRLCIQSSAFLFCKTML